MTPTPATHHPHHFEDLSPDQFERLVYCLVKRSGEFDEVQSYGGARDKGRDVVAYKHTSAGREKWYIQCKRYEKIAFPTLRDELDKLVTHAGADPNFAPDVVIFATACSVPPQVKDRAASHAREIGLPEPYYWGRWELDERLKTLPQTEREFFGQWALPLGVPFQAPPLPSHFIPRPEVTGDVKARLLSDDPAAPGVLVVSAIHGLGGIGKSVLAAALAHDPGVQQRFPDGVLWVTLDQQPDLLSLLSTWVQALGDYDFRPTTSDAASTHLRTLLHEKATLLVIDDAWDPAHVLPFRVGGPRCQVLVTTRHVDVADDLSAYLYHLKVMTPDQSLALLSARLGRPLPKDERASAQRLAKAVGHLPLALEMASTRVARGVSWVALCEDLEQEVARHEALESPRGRRRHQIRLEVTLNRSLEWLHAEDKDAWRCFIRLGVLPKDAVVAAPMAATLWGLDQAQASDLLALLRDDALLQAGSSVLVEERAWPGYRLHDLLHDLARRLLIAEHPKGLGLALPDAHARLLERYRAQTQDGLWHTLSDDGYIHAHIAWHIERAGQADALHSLLREETPDSHNGWYEARERLGQTAGYLADVEVAWRSAEEAFPAGRSISAVGLQYRYALIVASLNSLAGNIPPALLVTLVKRGMWSPSQGLAYARQVPDPKKRGEALAGLIPNLPESLLRDALATAWKIGDEESRSRTLAGLIPHLPELLLRDALAVARKIGDEKGRFRALIGLAPFLPEPLEAPIYYPHVHNDGEMW